jgi:endonuclease-3 related protein
MNIENSFELYRFLDSKNLLENSPKYWWPNVGTEWCLVSAILTQNTRWKNVEKSMLNLGEISLQKLMEIDENYLSLLITPSGFKNQKAKRLKLLAKNILEEFGNFKSFKEEVNREWLLSQKGVGYETADSILCYVCFKEIMVVDRYTQKLLTQKGIEFFEYEDIQYFLESGIEENFDKIEKENDGDINLCFARFHGMIVEYFR